MAPSFRARLLAAAAALSTLAASADALAFCRTKACDTDPSYGDVWDEGPQPTECVRNAQGCYIEGTPLWWPSTCLSFAVHRAGSASDGIDYDTANRIIDLAPFGVTSSVGTCAFVPAGRSGASRFKVASRRALSR